MSLKNKHLALYLAGIAALLVAFLYALAGNYPLAAIGYSVAALAALTRVLMLTGENNVLRAQIARHNHPAGKGR